MDRYCYKSGEMGGGDAGDVYEAQGESDHQIGIVPRERQKTASELSEEESGDVSKRKRAYSFGSAEGGMRDASVLMELRNLEEKVQELHSKNSFLQSDLEASQDMYFNMLMEKSKETEKNCQQLKNLQEKITQLKENLDEAQTALSAAETRRKIVEERLLEVKRENQQLFEEKQEYENESKALSAEVEECRKQLIQKEEEIECIRDHSSTYIDAWISNEKKELEGRIFDLIEANRELKTENKNLLEEMSLHNMEPYHQRVPEEVSSINLTSTGSQTDLMFAEDIHERLVVHDSGNELESSYSDESFRNCDATISTLDDERSHEIISSPSCCSCSCSSNSSPSGSDSPLSRNSSLPESQLSTQDHSLQDLIPKENSFKTPEISWSWNSVGKIVDLTSGHIRQGAFLIFLFFLSFVVFELTYALLWNFRPLKLTLDLSAAANQHGRLEHLAPPLI